MTLVTKSLRWYPKQDGIRRRFAQHFYWYCNVFFARWRWRCAGSMYFVHTEETAGWLFCWREVCLCLYVCPVHRCATFVFFAWFGCSDCEWFHRVQMSDLSSFQTTSFHTRLSFLDEENDENLLEDEEDDDKYDEEYSANFPSGSQAEKDRKKACVFLL